MYSIGWHSEDGRQEQIERYSQTRGKSEAALISFMYAAVLCYFFDVVENETRKRLVGVSSMWLLKQSRGRWMSLVKL